MTLSISLIELVFIVLFYYYIFSYYINVNLQQNEIK